MREQGYYWTKVLNGGWFVSHYSHYSVDGRSWLCPVSGRLLDDSFFEKIDERRIINPNE